MRSSSKGFHSFRFPNFLYFSCLTPVPHAGRTPFSVISSLEYFCEVKLMKRSVIKLYPTICYVSLSVPNTFSAPCPENTQPILLPQSHRSSFKPVTKQRFKLLFFLARAHKSREPGRCVTNFVRLALSIELASWNPSDTLSFHVPPNFFKYCAYLLCAGVFTFDVFHP